MKCLIGVSLNILFSWLYCTLLNSPYGDSTAVKLKTALKFFGTEDPAVNSLDGPAAKGSVLSLVCHDIQLYKTLAVLWDCSEIS